MKINIYNTGVISFIIQILIQIIDTFAILKKTDPSMSLIKELLWIEYAVNIIEGTFYIWMISSIHTVKNITLHRYADWIFSTPIMLFTFIAYFIYLNENVHNNVQYKHVSQIIQTEYQPIVIILLLNWIMLLFGYLTELDYLSLYTGVFLGFIPFIIMFYIIFIKYVDFNSQSFVIFNYVLFFWSLYGVAALLPYNAKNIMYNILDLFSKNIFSLFLAYIILSQ